MAQTKQVRKIEAAAADIPLDVTAEILSRLPIKSIGRFVLVCKDWNALIASRPFSVTRAKNTPFTTFYGVTSLDPSSQHRGHIIEVSEDDDDDYRSVATTKSLTPRVPESGSSIGAVGSCNGLLCLLERKLWFETFCILNPITNEKTLTITIPERDPDDGSVGYKTDSAYYRFGYSPSTDEYKVLKCFKMARTNEMGVFRCDYEIFTFGVDKRWRKLPPSLFPADDETTDDHAVPCNGAFHWLVGRAAAAASYDNSILAFDIAREDTRRIPIPQMNQRSYLTLSALENRLCLFAYHRRERDGVDVVWEMEGYGDSCWRRRGLFMVPDRSLVLSSRHITPLSCTAKRREGMVLRIAPARIYYCSTEVGICDGVRVPHYVRPLFEFTPSFSSIDDIMFGSNRSSN